MPRRGNTSSDMSSGSSVESQSNSFVRLLREFKGETVTIFTMSGGPSGGGFTGAILSANHSFVRLVLDQGTPPSNPLVESIFPDMNNGGDMRGPGSIGILGRDSRNRHMRSVGSVVDIPVENIAAFVHNTV